MTYTDPWGQEGFYPNETLRTIIFRTPQSIWFGALFLLPVIWKTILDPFNKSRTRFVFYVACAVFMLGTIILDVLEFDGVNSMIALTAIIWIFIGKS